MAASPTTAETNAAALGLLIYDGDCGFCTQTARKFADFAHASAAIAPWQSLDLADYGLTEADCSTAAYWVRDGVVHRGAHAVAQGLQAGPLPARVLGKLLSVPPFLWLAHGVYGLVAKNRYRLPGATDACRLDQRP